MPRGGLIDLVYLLVAVFLIIFLVKAIAGSI
jgi:hypothetical protein